MIDMDNPNIDPLVKLSETLIETGHGEVSIFTDPSYVSAFVGVSITEQAVYDYNKMVDFLVETKDMTKAEVIDFIETKTIRSLPFFDDPPIIFKPLI